MKLNCDLGEGLPDIDTAVMPYIDMANIACGGHTGDFDSMTETARLAQKYKVIIGAHPSYPDRENFGRHSLNIAESELADSLIKQISDLNNACTKVNAQVSYIKPHGALYNDLIHKQNLLKLLIEIADSFSLKLMLMAHPKLNALKNSNILFEAFADRAYTDEGELVSRQYAHAVHQDINQVYEQASNLSQRHGLYTESGKWIEVDAESLCVHSDSLGAVEMIKSIRQKLKKTPCE
ncbi:5-oxoprolinase subunit PxpA [Teredinibacter sp. KSP-S5-2]|uniref:5-oxoprolinase subunit PxpA n=1 Tax=Teredinibacter sp. KSP-S5-2 TaxID=3034506 RepID=UPI002934BD7E|nr:5-oxoprolinase subunit PxpA [Teredinibacter sp. KSP-S5-2]WNO08753.1 5-oxoprolinase subunit PxpA [Teredinibacter sp. KSP-S5-2]